MAIRENAHPRLWLDFFRLFGPSYKRFYQKKKGSKTEMHKGALRDKTNPIVLLWLRLIILLFCQELSQALIPVRLP